MTRAWMVVLCAVVWALSGCQRPIDADRDGYRMSQDCNDEDPLVHPGSPERCNGVDDDCDGALDENAADAPTWYRDADGDGYGVKATGLPSCQPPAADAVLQDGDCNDRDDRFHPGAVELCIHTEDYNCDGSIGFMDSDGDGAAACVDCDDGDAHVHPGAPEFCNAVDDDCNGTPDDDAVDAPPWYADVDGDGYGDDLVVVMACVQPPATSALGGDCDDQDDASWPGAPELCTDTVDYNCDNVIGDVDLDGDGTIACLDCDDNDPWVHPDAPEYCNDLDDDCDGGVDEDAKDEVSWHADRDGDGFGHPIISLIGCDQPVGYVLDGTDCDDTRADIHPGGTEVCDHDNRDEDCDTLADDADPSVLPSSRSPWYVDGDGDNFGVDGPQTVLLCERPAGYSVNAADCDDSRADVSPAGIEVCDAGQVDEDCDGAANDDDTAPSDPSTFYADSDGDGFGDPSVTLRACEAPQGWLADASDCDDSDATVRPGAQEYCDQVDDDCDGSVDEEAVDRSPWYRDSDGDGHGTADVVTLACAAPPGYAADATDCDDTAGDIYPGALDFCEDGIDSDCVVGSACAFAGTYASSTADVRLVGAGISDYLGHSVAIGDFDGDGYEDLLAGMTGYNVTGAPDAGAAALWYGPVDSTRSSNSADLLITGTSFSQSTGYDVAAADLNGDGIDDLVISATTTSSATGAVHIAYGGALVPGTQTTADLVSASGATFTGDASFDSFGCSLGTGGDLDGDGYDELLIGAYGQDGAAANAGAAYLVYGSAIRLTGVQNASSAHAILQGNANSDYLGYAVEILPDIDGDGLDEMLLGAYSENGTGTDFGAAYLVLGDTQRLAGTLSAQATADLVLSGPNAFDNAGYAVSALGDLDGDGYNDYGMHGYGYDAGGLSEVGALWIYEGGSQPSPTRVGTLHGAASFDRFGEEATSIGDLDADGRDDLVAGAHGADGVITDAGAVYMFYGAVTGTRSVASADATFLGPTVGGDAWFGRRLAQGSHDVTGDGAPDLIVGAWLDDDNHVPSPTQWDSGVIYIWTSKD